MRKKGRRKRKMKPWVKVETAVRGVETGRKGEMPVAARVNACDRIGGKRNGDYLCRGIGCTSPWLAMRVGYVRTWRGASGGGVREAKLPRHGDVEDLESRGTLAVESRRFGNVLITNSDCAELRGSPISSQSFFRNVISRHDM